VHPGYGFLSENARFARRCEQHGLTFVGPSAGAIRRMGDKIEAKRAMAAAGLPTIPGSDGPLASVEDAIACARAIGWPVLLKAVAGGGGKGMRRCAGEAELASGFEACRREAASAFGDGTLYLERFVEGARHIEFQIVADAFGQAIHLGERECSIQRQHQKLIEETPSPALDARQREELGRRVAAAVAALGYRSVGTLEFLRAPEGAMYFMEMNTRLQVEHPVTEMVTGLDLVALQLRIAANQRLGLTQDGVRARGHAIELRINAEDPAAGFRPDPGAVTSMTAPPAELDGVRVRWDSALRPGYRIPPHYDSLVGKLIVHGADRATAVAGARAALDALRIDGVRTTIGLHRRLLSAEPFVRGTYDLATLGRVLEGAA
jgi:acetyl-CoA carboxylase biotin carboxylase subunit